MSPPRGLRNRNPGNIVVSGWTVRQEGYTGPEPEGRFATFATMAHGLLALMRLLQNYRHAHGLATVRGIINRWAPPVENNTSSYVTAVAAALKVGEDEELPDNPATYNLLARAISAHENGRDAAAGGISVTDWADAMARFNGSTQGSVRPAPASPPEPVDATPSPAPYPASGDEPFPGWPFKEPTMAPIIAAAASSLLPIVADLFRMRGSQTSERNAVLVEKIGPALVDVAKSVAPAVNEQQTVEKILASDELKQALRQSVALRIQEFSPAIDLILKLEEAQRVNMDAAASRIERLGQVPIDKLLPFYLVAVGQFALTIIVMTGLGALLWPVIRQVASGAEVGELPSWASMIIGSLLIVIALEWRSIISFVVGTTQGSSAKNAIIERLSKNG
jgi:hypothetical protein